MGEVIMALSEPPGSKKGCRRDKKEAVPVMPLFQGHMEREKKNQYKSG
jgi:hypothetical protein